MDIVVIEDGSSTALVLEVEVGRNDAVVEIERGVEAAAAEVVEVDAGECIDTVVEEDKEVGVERGEADELVADLEVVAEVVEANAEEVIATTEEDEEFETANTEDADFSLTLEALAETDRTGRSTDLCFFFNISFLVAGSRTVSRY